VIELGLFPLPLVLFPTERIPLHIFEPRYRELIDECVETGGEFGLALATGDGAVHEIGTRARVIDVLEVLDDGRVNIVVEGGERFRLLELTSGRSFTTGLVVPVADDDDPAIPADVERTRSLFGELATVAESDVGVPDAASPSFDWEVAARVDLGVDAEQELLALQSPRARMARLAELLAIALEALQVEQALRERASRNGKVSPLDPEHRSEPGPA
jgi:Lon protease-like protein